MSCVLTTPGLTGTQALCWCRGGGQQVEAPWSCRLLATGLALGVVFRNSSQAEGSWRLLPQDRAGAGRVSRGMQRARGQAPPPRSLLGALGPGPPAAPGLRCGPAPEPKPCASSGHGSPEASRGGRTGAGLRGSSGDSVQSCSAASCCVHRASALRSLGLAAASTQQGSSDPASQGRREDEMS